MHHHPHCPLVVLTVARGLVANHDMRVLAAKYRTVAGMLNSPI